MVWPSRRGLEDTLHDSRTLRTFARIDLGVDPVPDATTLLNSWHPLQTQNLGKGLCNTINADLAARMGAA